MNGMRVNSEATLHGRSAVCATLRSLLFLCCVSTLVHGYTVGEGTGVYAAETAFSGRLEEVYGSRVSISIDVVA